MDDARKPGSRPDLAEHRIETGAVSMIKARQGQSGVGVKYVLAVSLSASLAVMTAIWFFFFGTP